MHTSAGRVFIASLVVLLILAFWSYRVRAAAEEAAEFQPAAISPILLRAETAIQAELRAGIPESASVGDTVVAFVSRPVVVDGKVVIPPDAVLKGKLEEVSVSGAKARLLMSFKDLVIAGYVHRIQTRPVMAIVPVQGDLETLGSAFDMLIGSTLGGAVGAASGDLHLVRRGMFMGAVVAAPEGPAIPFTLILTHDLSARREHDS